ncbi:glycoside hydrolase family 78 protein [Thozetella sp. PMI_491]|nr:glycoside hydrolase family 78 protein [Thozetella sp. PMI_491]
MSNFEIVDLRFEHHPTGLGVSVAAPRLSWRFQSSKGETPRNWAQTSYDVEVHRPSISTEPRMFSASSNSSILNPWPDAKLSSREAAKVRVKAVGLTQQDLEVEPGTESNTGGTQVETKWSEWYSVEAGLLDQGDWQAKCIGPHSDEARLAHERETGGIRPVRLRKAFSVPSESGAQKRARLYITALGLYEAYINGQRVGDEQMTPGWTSYDSRLQYQVYDVGSLLKDDGNNVIAIEIAEGWYAGRLVWREGRRCIWGDRIGAIAQLEILPDTPGSEPFRLVTDDTWSYRESPIQASGIYDGETYDLGQEEKDWHKDITSSSPQAPWATSSDILPFPTAPLQPSVAPPVRVTEEIRPVRILQSPSGKTLVDFGQNLVGRIRINHLRRPKGHRLQIRHAEVLEDGELSIRPLRAAKATDVIIFSEEGELKDWSPRFTFHGFQYIELEGWNPTDETDPLTLDSITALFIHTDMKRTGHFECSNDAVNTLHHNVVRSTRGNFLSIPTDCPQRDERLGWTGDIQVFSPTASFLFECAGMLGNWMKDVIADQAACGGVVPFVVPNVLSDGKEWGVHPQAVWDDVVVLLPWVLYRWFGDVELLRESFQGMRDHLDKAVLRGEEDLWDEGLWQLADWLDPNAPPQEPGLARTDGTLVADEYLVYVTGIVARVAEILELPDQAKKYSADHARLKSAFQDKYVTKAGLVVGDSQTSLALALNFSLLQGDNSSARQKAAARLVKLVRYAKFRVSTGFAGTPQILEALSSTGNLNIAYAMLLEKECPSWLYQVSMGASTTWERWDSMLPDGSINPGQMTSFNHYALGSVAEWIHANVGGISLLTEGWKEFAVRPAPGGDINSANAKFLSPYGLVKSSWRVDGSTFTLDFTVPPNSRATVQLPGEETSKVYGSGEYHLQCPYVDKGNWPPKALYTEFKPQTPANP